MRGFFLQERWQWPGWRRVAVAFGLGAVMALGQAPLEWWFVALPALVALTLLIVRSSSARVAAWSGLFAGAGYFGLALSWIVEPFLIDVATYGWMSPFAVAFMSFGLALFWALAAAVSQWIVRGFSSRALAFALALTAAELLRGVVLTGFPWALIGHIWIGVPPAQLAAIIGPNGLTLMTTLAAALPVAFRLRGTLVSGVMLAAAWGFGVAQLAQPDPTDENAATVRLVQPNIAQNMKWDSALARINLQSLMDLSAKDPAPGQPRPDLVVWPETALPYLFRGDDTGLLAAIAGSGRGAQMAIGVQRLDPQNAFRGFNSLAVISPDATLTDSYDKHHLVPFGEYIPFGDLAFRWFGLSAFAAQMGNGYTAGPGPRVLDLGPKLGLALPLICYEAVFPQGLRVATRPRFILQITNDAWFGELTGPYQHLAQARLRAIEQGLPFLRAANTGVSAVIDARGRVLAELPLGVSGILDASVPPALAPTLYARLGEVPILVLLIGLSALLVVISRRARP
tara:strand:- start:3672 stop:5207 length:1536 start_codon:yes stop_codon:yes gene_type:complete